MSNPKLRFKREDGTSYPNWKKDKWSKLGQFTSSGVLSKADLADEGTPCILYGELYTKYGEIAHTIYSKTNATSHIYSKADDVILPKSGETPEDISTATCIPFDNISLGGDLIVFRHNEKVVGTYLSYLISNRAKNAIASIAQGKSVVHISDKSLSNIELSYPCLEEQQKIADFLSTIDEVIAQSEAEVSNLQQQKKAAMQKIFSQEVRFKREDGADYPDWDEMQFGYLVDEYRDKTTIENEDVLLSSAIEGMFLNTELFDHQRGKSNKGYLKIKYGTLILSAQNLHLGNANVNLRFDHGIVSPAYKTYNIQNCDVRFMSHWIKRDETNIFFYNATTVGASQCRRNVNWNALYKQTVLFPHIEEQQKIADFLSAYDEAISYAKQELDKWRELKKGLLQQMFV